MAALNVLREGVFYDGDDANTRNIGFLWPSSPPYFGRNGLDSQCALASPTFAVVAWQHPYETRFTSFNPTTGEVYEEIGLPGNPGFDVIEVGPHRVVAIQWPGGWRRSTGLSETVGRVVDIWGPDYAGTAGHVTMIRTFPAALGTGNNDTNRSPALGGLHFDGVSTITVLQDKNPYGSPLHAQGIYVETLDISSFVLNARLVAVDTDSANFYPFQGGILVDVGEPSHTGVMFFAPDGTTNVFPHPAEVLGARVSFTAGSMLSMSRYDGEQDTWERFVVEYKDGALKWVTTLKDTPEQGNDPDGMFADLPPDEMELEYGGGDMEWVRPRGTTNCYMIWWRGFFEPADNTFYDFDSVWYRTVVVTENDSLFTENASLFADLKVPLRFGGDEVTWDGFNTGYKNECLTVLKDGYYLTCYLVQQAENTLRAVINTRVGFQFGQYAVPTHLAVALRGTRVAFGGVSRR